MKKTITLSLLLCTSFLFGQNCGSITTGSQFVHGNLQFNILNGTNALNELNYKVGIGPDGDIDTREYASIINSSNLWAGGKDPNGSIKLATGNYRVQDWTTGPLDENGQITPDQCLHWDRIFTVTKEDIYKARQVYLENGPCEDIPESVLNWPGRNNPNLQFIPPYFHGASFWDENGTGRYEPCHGNLPMVLIRGIHPFDIDEYFESLPSQMSYYVISGNGKLNNYVDGHNLPFEVGVYIFSYKSPEAEDAIFINYKTRSFASDNMKNFHFGNWFDFDLGCSENDAIGTDSERHMVYAYNTNEDNECNADGTPLPMSQFGISYLGGMLEPFMIVGDSLVTPPIGTGTYDTLVRSKMKTSIIPVNCLDTTIPNNCDPKTANDYYNIISGVNANGDPVLDNSGNETNKMFTGNPSVPNSWSLCNEDNTFPATTAISSAGNALVQPGASSEILLALFHVKDELDTGCSNIAALQYKQEKVQEFYESDFFHHVGPTPPTLEMFQTSDAITISISDIPYSYSDDIPKAAGFEDDRYRFEGIKIYQVKSSNFDFTELDNPDYSQMIYQGDIINEVSDITNYETIFSGGSIDNVPIQKVDGANEDIVKQFVFDYDYFLEENITLGKPYYFVAVSYAYNDYMQYNPFEGTGQRYSYLESTCGLKVWNSEVLLSDNELEIEKSYDFYNNAEEWAITNKDGQINVLLSAANGQKIGEWKLDSGATLDSREINDLPNGIYFLQIENIKHKNLNVEKIVVVN